MASDRLSVFIAATELAVRAIFFQLFLRFGLCQIMADMHWSLLHHQVWATLWNLPPTLHQIPQISSARGFLVIWQYDNDPRPQSGRKTASVAVGYSFARPLHFCNNEVQKRRKNNVFFCLFVFNSALNYRTFTSCNDDGWIFFTAFSNYISWFNLWLTSHLVSVI